MKEGFQLKDQLNDAVVKSISNQIKSVWPSFNATSFKKNLVGHLEPYTLTERSEKIATVLAKYLPSQYSKSVHIVIKSFGPESKAKEMSGYDCFYYMPFCHWVAANGLDHFDASIKAMAAITKRFTAEWPIRPFIIKYEKETLAQLQQWAASPNHHLRRLVSEGTRPRLPWASRLPKFQKNPRRVLKLLTLLKADPVLYVRRSVANNLNDISKDNPDLVLTTLKKWQTMDTPEMKWQTKHALRTLLKQGNPEALALLGFTINPKIIVSTIKLNTTKIKQGEYLNFKFSVTSNRKTVQRLMIDYKIHFMKANGKTMPKVFKLTKREITDNETIEINTKQSFKKIGTRKMYSGKHGIEIMINGVSFGTKQFTLNV